jgi:hypothetical protein
MPIYYFAATENAADIPPDDEGVEFETLKDACDEADRALREMSVDAQEPVLWMSVFDENRTLVHRARLEVVREPGEDC